MVKKNWLRIFDFHRLLVVILLLTELISIISAISKLIMNGTDKTVLHINLHPTNFTKISFQRDQLEIIREFLLISRFLSAKVTTHHTATGQHTSFVICVRFAFKSKLWSSGFLFRQPNFCGEKCFISFNNKKKIYKKTILYQW